MNQWPLRTRILTICVAVVVAIAYFLFTPPSVDNSAVISSSDDAIARGAYLVNAGGCVSCHLEVERRGVNQPRDSQWRPCVGYRLWHVLRAEYYA